MLEFNDNYIPLFLVNNDANISYIIDNKLLGASRLGSFGFYPYRAFSLILEFYKNEKIRTVIPEGCLKVLDTDYNVPHFYKKDLLIGELDQWYRHGITLEMDLNKDVSKSVRFYNFKYYHRSLEGKSLNRTITLPLKQAFHLIANILTNDRCHIFDMLARNYPRLELEELPLLDDIYSLEGWRINRFGKSYIVLTEFAFEYLKYLKKELLAEKISPASILHYSGVTTLAFLNELPPVREFINEVLQILKKRKKIALNQKVLYFALLHCTIMHQVYDKDDDVVNFIMNYPAYRGSDFDETVVKEFPQSKSSFNF